MFLVGGQILVHGIPAVHHWIEHVAHGLGSGLETVVPMLFDAVFGVAAGAVVLAVLHPIMKLAGKGH
jgi:predicted DNA repair protein MutK